MHYQQTQSESVHIETVLKEAAYITSRQKGRKYEARKEEISNKIISHVIIDFTI